MEVNGQLHAQAVVIWEVVQYISVLSFFLFLCCLAALFINGKIQGNAAGNCEKLNCHNKPIN
jgi:hypothetical protein